MKPELKAAQWFAEGVKKSHQFEDALRQTRRFMMDAAFNFMRARALLPHGSWGDFCELHGDEIAPRTVRFWCQLAEEAIAWVRVADPKLKSLDEIHAAARDLVIQSPKPLVALCRHLGHMRPFGEYDAVKYAQRKLGNGNTAQFEFEFSDLLAPLDQLCHFGEDNYTFKYPKGVDEAEFLDEALAKSRAVVKRLEAIKQHGRIIEA